jgi:DNA-binding CsgD family transcriptional regulator
VTTSAPVARGTRFADFIEILDFASAAATPWELLEGLTELVSVKVEAEQAVMAVQNRLTTRPDILFYNSDSSYADRYLDYYHVQDPFDITQYLIGATPAYSLCTDLARVSSCGYVDYDSIVSTEYYHDFCAPQGIHYAMTMRLDGGPSMRATLCVHRARQTHHFSVDGVELLESLTPHLSAHLQRTVDAAVAHLVEDDDEVGLVMVDAQGRMLYSNALAEQIFRLLSGPQAVIPTPLGPGEELVVESIEGRYVVKQRPVPTPSSPVAQVIEIRRVKDLFPDHGCRLRSRFGFSEREVEVLTHVVHGRRNQEIARLLFLSEHTVKKHISSMTHKSGLTGRAALIHAALREMNVVL